MLSRAAAVGSAASGFWHPVTVHASPVNSDFLRRNASGLKRRLRSVRFRRQLIGTGAGRLLPGGDHLDRGQSSRLAAWAASQRRAPIQGVTLVNSFPHDPRRFARVWSSGTDSCTKARGITVSHRFARWNSRRGRSCSSTTWPPTCLARDRLLEDQLIQLTWKNRTRYTTIQLRSASCSVSHTR